MQWARDEMGGGWGACRERCEATKLAGTYHVGKEGTCSVAPVVVAGSVQPGQVTRS